MKVELPFNDYDDIRGNRPAFIRRIYERPIRPRFSYSRFIANWHDHDGVVFTSYEVLRAEPVAELVRIVSDLTGEELEEGAPRRSFRATLSSELQNVKPANKKSVHFFARELSATGGTVFHKKRGKSCMS